MRGQLRSCRRYPLVGSLESTRSGEVAAEVSCGLGRCRWPKWRSPTNSVGSPDGDGEVQWQSKGRRSRLRRHSSESACGLDLGDALYLSKKDLAGAVWVFRAPGASAVRRMRGGAAHDHHGYFARVEVKLLAFTHCSAGCAERSHKNLPVFEAEGFCG